MADQLEVELKKYAEVLPSLLSDNEGKFVLICGPEVVGTFASYQDALKIGYEKCGVKPFLVKQISAVAQISYFSRDVQQPCPI